MFPFADHAQPPVDIAKQILADPTSYPIALIRQADDALKDYVARHVVVPVADVACANDWGITDWM